MRERAQELKAEAEHAGGEKAVLSKIAQMPEPDSTMAKRIHEIIKKIAPRYMAKNYGVFPIRDGIASKFFGQPQFRRLVGFAHLVFTDG